MKVGNHLKENNKINKKLKKQHDGQLHVCPTPSAPRMSQEQLCKIHSTIFS